MHSPSGLEPVNPQHSDLEPNSWQAAVYPDQGPQVYYESVRASNDSRAVPQPKPRVCELSRRIFSILVAVIIIITAVAFGGGLGARLSQNKEHKSANNKNETVFPQQLTPTLSTASVSRSSTYASANTSTTFFNANLVF